ncbi:MAG: lysophospholipid acyltransferase family protein [Ignavibacteria bacterium]|jgi:lysophospholipid acyltransferase (LPLAT)-like uncharacterized protein|nr:lysophospholipid acyltransferase family protein [Ignavibacteria bacterium]MDH7527821.1 lysophospholipid acyltransferase family protein [Ignavibacteria bacterium]NPV11056.1 lysophospholipid acyltransferase family protein [Ignavibacteria bacterium]
MKEFIQQLGIFLLPPILDLLTKTLKIEIENKEALKSGNAVFMFWHGKMLAGWWLGRNKNFYAVVSQSKDGEILSRLLKRWNFKLIRGSSSKDSKEVMREMVEVLKKGFSLAITPDGPRGPREEMKIGGLIASVRAQKPIVLCGISYEKKKIFKSWDKFELPKFFSRVKVRLSDPKLFPSGLSNDEYEQIRQKLEFELKELSKENFDE